MMSERCCWHSPFPTCLWHLWLPLPYCKRKELKELWNHRRPLSCLAQNCVLCGGAIPVGPRSWVMVYWAWEGDRGVWVSLWPGRWIPGVLVYRTFLRYVSNNVCVLLPGLSTVCAVFTVPFSLSLGCQQGSTVCLEKESVRSHRLCKLVTPSGFETFCYNLWPVFWVIFPVLFSEICLVQPQRIVWNHLSRQSLDSETHKPGVGTLAHKGGEEKLPSGLEAVL